MCVCVRVTQIKGYEKRAQYGPVPSSSASQPEPHGPDARGAKKYRSPSSMHHSPRRDVLVDRPEAAVARPPGECVLFLGKGSNIPNMDVDLSLSDCYANLSITDADGSAVSPMFRSMIRYDSLAPTWNNFVAFPIQPEDGDVLHVSCWTAITLHEDDAIGIASVIAELRSHPLGNPKVLELQLTTSTRAPDSTKPTTVTVSMLGPEEGPAVANARKQDAAF